MNRWRVAVWVCVGVLLIVGGLAGPGPARGQAASEGILDPAAALGWLAQIPAQLAAPEEPRTFGTADEVALVVGPSAFQPSGPTANWALVLIADPTTGQMLRRDLGGPTTWSAAVHLPSGAEVTRLEVSACDDSPTQELRFALLRVNEPQGTGSQLVVPIATTTDPGTPGCGRFSATPPTPLIIDNANHAYAVLLGTASPISFSSARVYYRLQVSPAPASATFGDVPTSHIFFRFVEALADAGITAGCGGGNYCPNAPVTRGQMAVFLSQALGLHFAP